MWIHIEATTDIRLRRLSGGCEYKIRGYQWLRSVTLRYTVGQVIKLDGVDAVLVDYQDYH